MVVRVTFFACLVFVLGSNVDAQNPKTPDVGFEIPEKDEACLPGGDRLFQSFVRLGNKEGDLGRGLAWRSSVLGKQVQAEGVAWFGRIFMDGAEIRLKGCTYSKEDHGKLVRVVGILRHDQGSWSRFGTVPPYFFIESDSYTVIGRVKQPVLACLDEGVNPIKLNIKASRTRAVSRD